MSNENKTKEFLNRQTLHIASQLPYSQRTPASLRFMLQTFKVAKIKKTTLKVNFMT